MIPKTLRGEAVECDHCQELCAEEVFQITHRYVKKKGKSVLTFCSTRCMIEHFEVHERTEEKIEQRVKKELSELYKRVCPACVRRFADLV